MKKVREYFHVLIAAVICLMVSMIPGKSTEVISMDENVTSESLSTVEGKLNEGFTQKFMDKVRYLWISSYLKRNRMWKKLFFWLQGPGDKKTALLFRNKKAAFVNC